MTSTQQILKKAKETVKDIAGKTDEELNLALTKMAEALLSGTDAILLANERDVKAAEGKISPVMIDRLRLTKERIEGMAKGIIEITALPSPLGKVIKRVERPNGLIIERVSVPMGVIAIIYESRPNVTSDAAALAIKSGSVCVLRGGKEAYNSARAIVDALGEVKTNGMMKKNCKNMQEFEKYFLTCARFLELAKNIYDYKQQKTAADGGTVC